MSLTHGLGKIHSEGYRTVVTLTDTDVAGLLAPAGLLFIKRMDHDSVRLPALPSGHSAASARPEHGRFDSLPDEVADVEADDMPEKVNAGWFRMATEFGLFNEDREFLLSVCYARYWETGTGDDDIAWVQVRLLNEWDLAASEVDLLRSWMAGMFTERFVPEFTMASLDGQMKLNTTVWGDGTVSTIVIRPGADRANSTHRR
ncbi:hypothetical protein ACFQQB_08505 [Nonomuraea rubra]|uniref:hypothetical protein n=1 Tax=Nonomuraea rubra TaxID=46180 RepID=UPI0031E9CF12